MQVTDEMVRVARGVYNHRKHSSINQMIEEMLTAALAAMWQPIETAPSGELLIVCGYARAGYYVADAMLIDGSWMLFDLQDDAYSVESSGHTHWMRLPPAPSQLSKRDDAERDTPQEA